MLANNFEPTFTQDDLDLVNLLQQNMQDDLSVEDDLSENPGAPVIRQQTSVSKHVLISSLPQYYTKEMLYLLAARFGQLVKVKLISNAQTHELCGLVEFVHEKDAIVAVKMLQNYLPQGTNKAIQASFSLNQEADNLKTNVYVSGLPFDMKSSDFNFLFSQFGPIVESKISMGKFQDELGRPKQLGFVRYADPAHAELAIQTMNGSVIKDSQNPALSFRVAARLAKETKNPLQKEKIKKKIAEVKALTHNLPATTPAKPVTPQKYQKANFANPQVIIPSANIQSPMVSFDSLRATSLSPSPTSSAPLSSASSSASSPLSSSPSFAPSPFHGASPSKEIFEPQKVFSLSNFLNPLSFPFHQAL